MPSHDELADVLIEGIGSPVFQNIVTTLGMEYAYSPAGGGVLGKENVSIFSFLCNI